MNRHVLACVSIALLAACQGGETTVTSSDPASGPAGIPSLSISDASHGGANPHFSWLPPMVTNSVTNGTFNPNLLVTVSICPWDGLTCGTPVVYPNVPVISGKYQLNWTVPNSSQVQYRISALIGSTLLGYADVWTAANAKDLNKVDKTQFVTQTDGSTLPIKFHIGEFALCPDPGHGPCVSETVDLGDGGIVTLGTNGVDIPPQDPGDPSVVVTVSTCPDLNPTYIDLPVFGSCIRITTEPALPEGALDNPATVFVCDLAPDLTAAGLSDEEEHYVTLHRRDGAVVKALPHVPGCAIGSGAVSFSVKGMLVNLVHGRLGAAGRQVLSLLGPKPLYARKMRLDEGGGGSTDGFSDFQFVRAAKMDIVPASNNQFAAAGSQLPTDPTVLVTDLGGNPVEGATVHFGAPLNGSLGAASAVSDANGFAHVSWTINAGVNHVTATGRGIATPGEDGPRTIFDPFMPLQAGHVDVDHPYGVLNPSNDLIPGGPALPFQLPLPPTGLAFTATGLIEPISTGFFNFGSSGYTWKIIASGASTPSGWQSLLTPFDPFAAGFSIGSAGFGTSGCGNLPGTAWTPSTDILVRKKFTMASAQSVRIFVPIDNDLKEVWFNGTLLNPSTLAHEGCGHPLEADVNTVVFNVTSVAGVNLIAIRASDRGGETFVDVKTRNP